MKLGTVALVVLASSALSAQDDELKRKFFADVHAALALKPGVVVADVGSGDDPVHARSMAIVVGPAGRIVCVDITKKRSTSSSKTFRPGRATSKYILASQTIPCCPEPRSTPLSCS